MLLGGLEVPLWVVLSTATGGLLVVYSLWKSDPYKNSEIPGPRSWPFLGSGLEYMNLPMPEVDVNFREKYGKLVLTYDGSQPNVLIYDPEFIRQTFINQFDSLIDRRPFILGGALDYSLLNATGDHWRHSRHALSPSFSSGKLKQMIPTIHGRCETFLDVVRGRDGEPVPIRKLATAFTLEVIAYCGFGVEADCQRDPENDPFMKNSQQLLGQLEKQSTLWEKVEGALILMLVLTVNPRTLKRIFELTGWTLLDSDSSKYLEALCEKMVDTAKDDTSRNDLLTSVSKLMVDVGRSNPDTQCDDLGLAWTDKGMSHQEVVATAITFLFAGFSTSSDTLQFLVYELALNPQCQDKVREELNAVCTTDEVSYDQIQELPYTEWCLNEAMRLYPAGFRFDRMVKEDVTACGITLKKGSVATVGAYAIHRNPEYWENPNDFEPERWSEERSANRHNCAFLPFGYGPRVCIGMRLAMLTMKIYMAYLVKNFEILPCDKTPVRPVPLKNGFQLVPKEPIEVILRPFN